MNRTVTLLMPLPCCTFVTFYSKQVSHCCNSVRVRECTSKHHCIRSPVSVHVTQLHGPVLLVNTLLTPVTRMKCDHDTWECACDALLLLTLYHRLWWSWLHLAHIGWKFNWRPIARVASAFITWHFCQSSLEYLRTEKWRESRTSMMCYVLSLPSCTSRTLLPVWIVCYRSWSPLPTYRGVCGTQKFVEICVICLCECMRLSCTFVAACVQLICLS